MRSGRSPREARRAAITGASRAPRLDSGRSLSGSPGSFQLDFACRNSVNRFTRLLESEEAGLEPRGLRHHRLIPRRVEHELDLGALDGRDQLDLLADVGGEDI